MKKRKLSTLLCLLLMVLANIVPLIATAETTTSSDQMATSSTKKVEKEPAASSEAIPPEETSNEEKIKKTSEATEQSEESTSDSQAEEPKKEEDTLSPKPRAAKFLIEGTDIDAKFAQYLRTNMSVQDKGGGWSGYGKAQDQLTDEMMAELTLIKFDYRFTGMDSLKGIEYATNLVTLEAPSTYINSIDITKNTKLETVNLNNTNISVLDVSKNIKLTSLYCYTTKISSLDISKNKDLEIVDCSNGDLANFTINEKLSKLKSLDLNNNPKLITVNLSNAENLEKLEIQVCFNLTGLDISKLTKLTYLDCNACYDIKTIDVRKNIELTYVDCSGCRISGGIDVSLNPKLEQLYCDDNGNNFSELKATNNPVLKIINCSSNDMRNNFDISGAPAVETLIANNAHLESIDLSQNTKLTYLDIQNNLLPAVDVTKQPDLRHFNCRQNSIPELNLKNNKKLEFLDSTFNKQTELDVSENKALTTLKFGKNQLSAIDVSNNPELKTLTFEQNKFETLPDLTINQKLQELDFGVNHIRDITRLKNLPNLSSMEGGRQEFTILTKEIVDGKHDFVLKTTNNTGLSASNVDLPGSPTFSIAGDTVKAANLEPHNITTNRSYTFAYNSSQLAEGTGYKSFSGTVRFITVSELETKLVPDKTQVVSGERVKWTWTTTNVTQINASQVTHKINLPTGLVIDESTINFGGSIRDMTYIDGSRKRTLQKTDTIVVTFETIATGNVGQVLEGKADNTWYDNNAADYYDVSGKGSVTIKAPEQFKVNIEKLDFDDKSTPLKDVKFELFKDNGSGGWTSQGIKTTDQDGKVGYIGLLAGKYKLVEVSTIDGYQMGGEQLIDIPNDVPANQDTLNLKVYNKKKTKLPQTGGTGSILIHLLGVLTLFSGFVFYQQKISWGEK
ncbi:SpaA isopeptide-forming pilin-related protein [Enterococcus malodoratus]|uniref:LPXTG-domain-containing protein cell wall anchor domain n=1 Tax=Enterococcus malodoratus ATCC 43197 TaxID=1158601 RepID=R2RP88_9ENTE|nr:SpaA isopeptide-forming pilin-related protein [Enterococcus malodoratus]EOH77829.1 hypothetical protein UAI_01916 [Enterococcus malodoratus ATCC 43197]EOT64307.1 hypothetical protein I585_03504 [Enterococcus malodoratus ATCC 43197]OJG59983.1 hypothetical protein RV07_GL002524 [Enterococcus malodoratus]SPW92999.1 Internalin-J precursor [Enterococcus malodoratus]STD66362.1 Internalin-J precursor [Enterococcus malodoratus]